MLLQRLHPHHHGLIHLVADDRAGAGFPHGPVVHGKPLEIFHLHFFPPPFAGFAGAAAAFGAVAALGAAPGAALMVGAAPGAAFGPLAAGAAAAPAAVGAAMAPTIPSTPSPGFTSAGPLILTSTAALTPDLMPRVRVFMGSL